MQTIYFAAFMSASTLAHGLVVWNESVKGDLSGEPSAPTVINVSRGDNIIKGTVGPMHSDWRDIFILNITDNSHLEKIIVQSYKPSDQGYTTVVLSAITEVGPIVWWTARAEMWSKSVGKDLGVYLIPAYKNDLSQYFSLWELNPASYKLNFVYSAFTVPEPSGQALLGGAMLALAALHRGWKRSA